MYQIACPHCGPRAQTEFTYERTVDSVVVPGSDPVEAMQTLYTRANPMGLDEEIWRHTYGCRGWMILKRHRVTHVIDTVRALGPETLP